MPKINKLYAFVAEDQGPEDEGIMAYMNPVNKVWVPLVGADLARLKSLKNAADAISENSGKPHRVLEFSVRTDITDQI